MENLRERVIKVAVVEDDKTVREGLEILLNGFPGFSCIAAFSNAEEALANIPELLPDVVLMDINLPGISGIECIISLKLLELPVLFIMLTVFEDPDAIFESLAAGASGYLLKNTPPARLMEAIQDVYRGGSPMSGEIARKVVESFHNPKRKSLEAYGLTSRENEILSCLSRGLLYKEIGEQLNISIDTVRSHIRHIYEKLHVQNRTEAILKYLNK